MATGYVQLKREACAGVLQELRGADCKALFALISYSNKHGVCYPSLERLANDTGLGLGSVRRSLLELERHGLLDRQGPTSKERFTLTEKLMVKPGKKSTSAEITGDRFNEGQAVQDDGQAGSLVISKTITSDPIRRTTEGKGKQVPVVLRREKKKRKYSGRKRSKKEVELDHSVVEVASSSENLRGCTEGAATEDVASISPDVFSDSSSPSSIPSTPEVKSTSSSISLSPEYSACEATSSLTVTIPSSSGTSRTAEPISEPVLPTWCAHSTSISSTPSSTTSSASDESSSTSQTSRTPTFPSTPGSPSSATVPLVPSGCSGIVSPPLTASSVPSSSEPTVLSRATSSVPLALDQPPMETPQYVSSDHEWCQDMLRHLREGTSPSGASSQGTGIDLAPVMPDTLSVLQEKIYDWGKAMCHQWFGKGGHGVPLLQAVEHVWSDRNYINPDAITSETAEELIGSLQSLSPDEVRDGLARKILREFCVGLESR